jgi:hypothetical protein
MDNSDAKIESGSPNTALKKCTDLWFDDGNIVLEAEGVGFKVYRGYLAQQSPVFAAMLTFPASQSPEDMYGGCPLVHMPDPADHLRYLLIAMNDPRYVSHAHAVEITFSQRILLVLGSAYRRPNAAKWKVSCRWHQSLKFPIFAAGLWTNSANIILMISTSGLT